MAKTKPAPAPRAGVHRPEILDIAPANPDLQTAEQDGGFIREFLKSIGPFFQRATALEAQAKGTLSVAKSLQTPTTMEEDELIQAFVKRTKAENVQVLEHWTPTSVIYRFYKSLYAAQQRPVLMLKEAGEIGNRLHQTYADNERRRVADENERKRKEAERIENERKQKEADDLEAEAVKLEEGSPILSDRERVFVDGKVLGMDDYKAATRAGFAHPRTAADRLMKSQKIQDAIQAGRTANSIREQAAAKRAEPVNVQVQEEKPQISKAVGHDRSTHSAELLDEQALLTAILGCAPKDLTNRFGIPADVLTINPVKLNEYARKHFEAINRWPGVRYKKETRLV